MISKFLRISAVLVIFCLVAGCDPEEIIRNKVPLFLQELLTFGSSPAGKKVGIPLDSLFKIKSPKPNEVIPVDKETVFQAELKIEDDKGPKPELIWTIFREKQPSGEEIGRGPSLRKKLPRGKYRAELALIRNEQRAIHKVNFSVGYVVSGKVLTEEGASVPQVELKLTDPVSHQLVGDVRVRNDGTFSVELPSEADFKLTPFKKGYTFTPLYQMVKHGKEQAAIQFTAQKGEISDIHLKEGKDAETNLDSICPSQALFVKFQTDLENKPSLFEVFLVQIDKDKERTFQFEVKEHIGSTESLHGPNLLKVISPPASVIGPPADSYLLRMKIKDEKGNHFLAESTDSIKIEVNQCLKSRMEEAYKAQINGDQQRAIQLYALVEEQSSVLQETISISEIMQKAAFNRGLAYLSLSLDDKSDDPSRNTYLNRAIIDFNSLLKGRKKDAAILLFRGAAYQMKGDYKAALKDYDAAVQLGPPLAKAHELRAYLYLKNGLKKDLFHALDDFTQAIVLEPTDESLRASRRETMKLAIKLQNEPDDYKIDTSQIPTRSIKDKFEIVRYLRK